MRAAWFVLVLAACGPRVDPRSPFDDEDPRATLPGAATAGDDDAADADADARARPAAAPAPRGPVVREGAIARATLTATLDAHPGELLRCFEVAAVERAGKFAGWRLVRFVHGCDRFAGVDLAIGDVLVSVNGRARAAAPPTSAAARSPTGGTAEETSPSCAAANSWSRAPRRRRLRPPRLPRPPRPRMPAARTAPAGPACADRQHASTPAAAASSSPRRRRSRWLVATGCPAPARRTVRPRPRPDAPYEPRRRSIAISPTASITQGPASRRRADRAARARSPPPRSSAVWSPTSRPAAATGSTSPCASSRSCGRTSPRPCPASSADPHLAALTRARAALARAGKDAETALVLALLAAAEPARAHDHGEELAQIVDYAEPISAAPGWARSAASGAGTRTVLAPLIERLPAPDWRAIATSPPSSRAEARTPPPWLASAAASGRLPDSPPIRAGFRACRASTPRPWPSPVAPPSWRSSAGRAGRRGKSRALEDAARAVAGPAAAAADWAALARAVRQGHGGEDDRDPAAARAALAPCQAALVGASGRSAAAAGGRRPRPRPRRSPAPAHRAPRARPRRRRAATPRSPMLA
ncbi:MAG: hypothetical protein HS111_15545 [Kofleriaceae bacterium]|nr:hypothetical protein [Kofleriaceae bacterium]